MPVLSSEPVPPLRPGGIIRANEIQEQVSLVMRQLVDNVALGQAQVMCQNSPPQIVRNSAAKKGALVPSVWNQKVHQQMANTVNMEMQQKLIESVARGFLPHVCNEHVHRFEHELIRRHDKMQTIVYCKWTFFNDQDMRLELEWHQDMDAGITHTELRQALTPLCDDYEEWQAMAIMKCEAGEDVWPRPKPSSGVSGNFSATAAQVRAQQQASQSQMQSAAAGLSSGLLGGVLSGLNRGLLK